MSGIENATLWFMQRHERYETEKPYLYTYAIEDGSYPANLTHEPYSGITIRNLRHYVPAYEKSGIGFLDIPTGLNVEDYDNRNKVETVFLPKIREAVKSFLGADIVQITEYKLRKRDPAFPVSHGQKYRYEYSQPTLGAHVDYTQDEIDEVIKEVCQDEIEDWTKYRVQAFNLWSPLRGPLRDWPLCVCDSSTVAKTSLPTADVIFPDKVAENYQVHHDDEQEWYYIEDQMPTEFLLFRATDTAKREFTAVPHCSFQRPQSSATEFLRESIEIRALALHKNMARTLE